MEIKYIDIVEVYFIHEKMQEISGGITGIRDFTLLYSAVERPKATFGAKSLYPTLWLKIASLIHSLINNHPFNDGNKRTGFFSALRFLKLNGYDIKVSKKEIVNFTLNISNKKLKLNQIAWWFQKHARIKT